MFKLPSDSKDLMTRLRLIKAENTYNIQLLTDLFEKAKNGSLSEVETKQIMADFKSDEYGFDDIYKIKLAVCDWLLNIESKSDDFVRFIDWDAKEKLRMTKAGIELPDNFYEQEYVDYRRASLKDYGVSLSRETKKEVQARLALLEVFARILPNDLIPKLVSICPMYLGCPIIQKWIMNNQVFYLYGDSKQQEECLKRSKSLNKALLPDKRKKKRQTLEYWQLDRYFNKLTNYIVGHRIAKKEGRLDLKYLKIFFDIWEIPSIYEGHFVSEMKGPKELALEIMISKGLIKSESSFREFQPRVNKLKKKHYGVELSLVLEDVLDLPIRYPQMVANPKLWDLLT